MALYRSVVDRSKVGAHAMRDLARNTVFGPWMDEDEDKEVTEEQPSSRWMRVRRRHRCADNSCIRRIISHAVCHSLSWIEVLANSASSVLVLQCSVCVAVHSKSKIAGGC